MATIDLRFDPISSIIAGVRDVAVDFTGALETSEVLTTQTVTSSDTDTLTVTNTAINASVITKKTGGTIAIGKGVQIRLTTVVSTEEDVPIYIEIVGDSGTKETYEVIVPIVPRKTF